MGAVLCREENDGSRELSEANRQIDSQLRRDQLAGIFYYVFTAFYIPFPLNILKQYHAKIYRVHVSTVV